MSSTPNEHERTEEFLETPGKQPSRMTQCFDVSDTDDRAVFPMRYVSGLPYIIVNKKHFKVFETENTYVLEALPDETV